MLILCGGLRTDYIITAANQVRLTQMGGNTIFGAVGAKLWLRDDARDERIAVLSRVGDNWPHGWTEDLQRAGFLTEGIRNIGGQQDLRTFYAYVDTNTRDDTHPERHFARLGLPLPPALHGYVHSTPGQGDPYAYEPLAVTPEDFDLFLQKQGSHHDTLAGLHIAPMSFPTQLNLPRAARARGVGLISIDPGERNMWPSLLPHIESMLSEIDVFLPSDQEVASLFPVGDPDPLVHAKWFAERGPRWVVIKLGSKGCLVYERATSQHAARQWHVPVVPVEVVDVTGAGDTFCGGFMVDFVGNGDPLRAAIRGSVAASLCIQDYGALHVLDAPAEEVARREVFLSGLAREL